MELELDLDKETAWTTQINSLEQDIKLELHKLMTELVTFVWRAKGYSNFYGR